MFDHLHQPHLFPHNPYPIPPPPIAHKVWILDCSSCHLFLTNRAMKAVLLLRPNVSLFSSDALPANCSADTASPDAFRPVHGHKPNASRTCECLTQTLCCYGCGSAIGYMIVVPCNRCTSSITATNRATNGHRFVFHSSEVTGTERHYIRNEPGVTPFDPPPPNYFSYIPYPQDYAHPRAPSPVFRVDYLPTPPLEYAGSTLGASRHEPQSPGPDAPGRVYPYAHAYANAARASLPPIIPPQSPAPAPSTHLPSPVSPIRASARPPSPHYSRSRSSSPSTDSDAGSPPPLVSPTFGYPADHKDPPPPPPRLQPGDLVFWHHLARTGEIAGVEDDERARSWEDARDAGRVFFDR